MGGVLGRKSSYNKFGGCEYLYNIGEINGNNYVGPYYGDVNNKYDLANWRNLYNTGVVNGVEPDIDEDMPTILSVVGEKFVEDTEGINDGYPILAWQVE